MFKLLLMVRFSLLPKRDYIKGNTVLKMPQKEP